MSRLSRDPDVFEHPSIMIHKEFCLFISIPIIRDKQICRLKLELVIFSKIKREKTHFNRSAVNYFFQNGKPKERT